MMERTALLGMLQMAAGFLFYSMGDALTKILATKFNVPFFLVLRCGVAIFGLCLFIYIVSGGLKGFKTNRPLLHMFRGIFFAALMYGATIAFKFLPFSQAYLIFFSAPLWTVLLGIVLFKERVSIGTWSAIVGGFLGVALTLDLAHFDWNIGIIAALSNAVFFALYSITGRYIDRKEPPALIALYSTIPLFFISGVHAGIPMEFFDMMTIVDVVMFLMTGPLLIVAIILHAWAFQNAPTKLVAPLHYTQIVYGFIFDVLMGEAIPDWPTWAGGAIIILSGLYLILSAPKEAKADNKTKSPQPE